MPKATIARAGEVHYVPLRMFRRANVPSVAVNVDSTCGIPPRDGNAVASVVPRGALTVQQPPAPNRCQSFRTDC